MAERVFPELWGRENSEEAEERLFLPFHNLVFRCVNKIVKQAVNIYFTERAGLGGDDAETT